MKKKERFEIQLLKLSLIPSAPLLILLLLVMVWGDVSMWLILLVGFVGILLVSYVAYHIFDKVVFQFRSLNNLLEAMIQGEYSLRASMGHTGGALDELIVSINGLAERLSQQRWEASENHMLVQTIIEHIDVAIVALTDENKVSFLNPAAEKLLQIDQSAPQKELGSQLAFAGALTTGDHQVVELSLGRQRGSFNVHVAEFRKSGKQHKLLFISDVTTLLRREERKAWQNLVRVISHEINNSLSPIGSISQTLKRLVEKQEHRPDISADLIDGLSIITERSKALGQFIDSYKQLAKLPDPQKKQVSLRELLEKISTLFNSQNIVIDAEQDVSLSIDPIQFEQVLINLFKNAQEAMEGQGAAGIITVSWYIDHTALKLTICDEGQGVKNPANIFVPFYSTKKNGSGIGLVLCRQIIEVHEGRLSLVNRENGAGCCAIIDLPNAVVK